MTTGMRDEADRDDRMGQVLAAYIEALDAGQAPDREALFRQHPDLAEDLAAYFAQHDRFQRLVEPLRPIAQGIPLESRTQATASHQPPRTDPPEPTRPDIGTTLAATPSPTDDLPEMDGG